MPWPPELDLALSKVVDALDESCKEETFTGTLEQVHADINHLRLTFEDLLDCLEDIEASLPPDSDGSELVSWDEPREHFK